MFQYNPAMVALVKLQPYHWLLVARVCKSQWYEVFQLLINDEPVVSLLVRSYFVLLNSNFWNKSEQQSGCVWMHTLFVVRPHQRVTSVFGTGQSIAWKRWKLWKKWIPEMSKKSRMFMSRTSMLRQIIIIIIISPHRAIGRIRPTH